MERGRERWRKSTHAEQVRVRRVGTGLGTRKPLMGEVERSLWRHGGRRRELGDTGELGERASRGGVVERAPRDVASVDMTSSF